MTNSERTLRWRLLNPEAYQASVRRYERTERRRELVRRASRRWKKAHPDRVRASHEKYRKTEKCKATLRAWKRRNPTRRQVVTGSFKAMQAVLSLQHVGTEIKPRRSGNRKLHR